MKFRILLLICFATRSLFAQTAADNIYGKWVKIKLTYKDGTELPEENILKNIYVKYIFTVPDKMNISQAYFENGTPFFFEILNNEIIIRTAQGGIMNQIRIEKLARDTMVLLQRGRLGFDDPTALRYTFTSETSYQNSLPLKGDDIYAITAIDTIYKENMKVYANYQGDRFQRYIYNYVDYGNPDYMTGKSGHLVASFIVSKTGVADSLKILESINADFDKRFIKAFNKAKKDWKPAISNGKYVRVQMFVDLTYGTFGPAFSADQYTNKANAAFKQNDYKAALYYYDQALSNVSFDKENLYNRGICKKMLGNLSGACEDWKKLKELGGDQADALLEKYCH